MSSVAVPSESKQISRFRLQRPLGQGAQGVVYVAYDPQLDRQVAIKTLLLGSQDAYQAQMLIASAKTASSLSHPNIVPVFEVGIDAGQPYVVFEYVEGRTLAALLQAEGALSMAQAVVMMSQILAGMAHVHASGLLHGDIKPANILIGANGIPRVTDFGISRRALAATGAAVHCGTVQYMAPECLSEGRADYRSDVFSLGLLFHEMLTGKPAFEGSDYSVMYRILNEVPAPPSAFNPRIDRRLDDIVLKALQRDPAQRYADAAQMKLDLDRFRVPASSKDAELREKPLHSTVEFLLRRMSFKSDFPALSASFARINQLAARADEASLKAISDLVMRDFALAQKLLRIVNSTAYAAGKVTKVSHAITLLGLSQLRAVVTGMMLAAGGSTGPRRKLIDSALTDAFVTGVIARNVGRMLGANNVEELFICGMFSRLGELLTLNYLGDEHDTIMARIADEGLDAATASQQVLGLDFDQLGVEVAAHWKFPELIVQALHPLPAGRVAPAQTDAERMHVCTAYARELCALARDASPGERERSFAKHQARYADAAAVDADRIRLLIGHSVTAAMQYVKASGIKLIHTPALDGMRALAEPAVQTQDAAAGEQPTNADASTRAPAPAPDNASASGPRTRPEGPSGGVPETVQGPSLRRYAGMAARLLRAWRALF